MAAAIAAVAILTVLVIAGVVFFVRAEVSEVTRTESRLRNPQTPTVAYAIPNGVDPVAVGTALKMAGFESIPDQVGDAECLRIECAPEDREKVREVIAGVHVTTYDGSDLQLDHAVFEDER